MLKKNKKNLEKLTDSYGSLYLNLKIEPYRTDEPLWNVTLFFIRRMIITFFTVLCLTLVFAQVWVINITSMALMVYYFGQKPFNERFFLNQELLNEMFVYVSSLFLMCFTDFVIDPVNRYDIGGVYFKLMYGVLGLNLLFILYRLSAHGLK